MSGPNQGVGGATFRQEALGENPHPPFSAPKDRLHVLACGPLLRLQSQRCSTFKALSGSDPLFLLSLF